MLIDAHLHVWRAAPDFPNPGGTTVSPLSDVPVEVLRQYMVEFDVDRAVIVQPLYPGEDNSYVADCAAAEPQRSSVAHFDENVGLSIQHDQIDFADATCVVAGDDGEASFKQVSFRNLFEVSTAVPRRLDRTPVRVPGVPMPIFASPSPRPLTEPDTKHAGRRNSAVYLAFQVVVQTTRVSMPAA